MQLKLIMPTALRSALNHFIDAHDQRLISKDELLMAEHLIKRALKPPDAQ